MNDITQNTALNIKPPFLLLQHKRGALFWCKRRRLRKTTFRSKFPTGVQAATGQLQKTHSPRVHVIDACWACTGLSLAVIKQWQQFPGSPRCALVGFRYMFLKFLPPSNLHHISEPGCPFEAFSLPVLQEGLQLPPPTSEIYSQANTRRDELRMVTAEYQYLFYIPDSGFLPREVHLKSWPHSSNSSVGLVTLREI